jgi:putative NADPH-quinone reductase
VSETLRVLGLAGSPRRRGNTETLLDQCLSGAEQAGAQTDKVVVPSLNIAGCVACGGCSSDGVCVVQDDFQAIDQRLVESDVIAVAAPLFFWNVPAELKALIDRGQSQWSRKFLAKKPLPPTLAGRSRRRGVLLCLGADPRKYFEGAIWTVRSFFRVHEAAYWGELCYSAVEARGAIREHLDVMDRAADLGRRAVNEDWTQHGSAGSAEEANDG